MQQTAEFFKVFSMECVNKTFFKKYNSESQVWEEDKPSNIGFTLTLDDQYFMMSTATTYPVQLFSILVEEFTGTIVQ